MGRNAVDRTWTQLSCCTGRALAPSVPNCCVLLWFSHLLMASRADGGHQRGSELLGTSHMGNHQVSGPPGWRGDRECWDGGGREVFGLTQDGCSCALFKACVSVLGSCLQWQLSWAEVGSASPSLFSSMRMNDLSARSSSFAPSSWAVSLLISSFSELTLKA